MRRCLSFSAKSERVIIGLLLAILAFLKIAYAFRLRIDSDETQHLHVIWGWTARLLPYRDFFDNHSPLFQFLCVPLFSLLGERANIVSPMRLVTVPLYFVSLWCAYRIGKNILSPRAGAWAAVVTGAYAPFFINSSEIRPDDLWVAFWLLSILCLTQRPLMKRNAFFAGLALGASFATSMKTTALALSLLIAGVAIVIAKISRRESVSGQRLLHLALTLLLGVAILPATVVVFFASKGALPNLYYCVIEHNLVRGLFKLHLPKRWWLFDPLIAFTAVGGYFAWRNANEAGQGDRIALVAISAIAYSVLISAFWPMFEPYDILPVAPMALIFVIPLVSGIIRSLRGDGAGTLTTAGFSIIAFVEIITLLVVYPLQANAMTDKISMIANALSLTTKNDFVMDPKGEYVFRRRAFYYVLEGLTIRRLQLGLIKDNIPETLIATRAPVATTLRLPQRAREFVEQNYVPLAFRLCVLGKMLGTHNDNLPKMYEFDIAIPARYAVVSERGQLNAIVDGTPLDKSRFLEAGHHQAIVSSGAGRIAVIWARAIKKRFSPFVSLANDVFRPED